MGIHELPVPLRVSSECLNLLWSFLAAPYKASESQTMLFDQALLPTNDGLEGPWSLKDGRFGPCRFTHRLFRGLRRAEGGCFGRLRRYGRVVVEVPR